MGNNFKEKLIIIEEREVLGKEFRIYGTLEDPLFLAKDVAEWIGHSDVSTMLRKIDEDEKVTNIVCTLGGNQKSWFLTEDGLYEVLMQSRKPIAKKFKKEVKKILKDIRRFGMYATDELLNNPDLLIQAGEKLKAEKERIEQLEAKVEELEPKADYTDKVLNSEGLITTNTIAKDYDFTAQGMNNLLHDLGIQYKQGKRWFLYKEFCGNGYVFSGTSYNDVDNTSEVITKWTQKGKRFIYKILKVNGIKPITEKNKKIS